MLVLAGLGLFDEKDLTLRGLEEAKTADKVFIETYTNKWCGDVRKLEDLIGKKITLLKRKDMEENSNKLIELSKTQKILIFVPGDPLVATTHSSIVSECLKKNIEVLIIHNSSIISAIAESGLHIYRFGATVTLPSKEKIKTLPKSVYQTIVNNLKTNLHTLCLLDINLKVEEALDFLKDLETFGKYLPENLIVMSQLGSPYRKIFFGKIESLKEKRIGTPAVIIIPSKLHFSEKEYIENFSI